MGRKKRDKRKFTFRLYPETHYALNNLMKRLNLKETEEALELLLSFFNTFLITASQISKTDSQFSHNCQSEKITDSQLLDFCQSVIRNYEEIVGSQELPEPLKSLRDKVLIRCEPRSPLGCISFTPEVNHMHQKYNKGNNIKRNNNNDIRHSTYVECLSSPRNPNGLLGLRKEIERGIPDTPPITEETEKNMERGANANDLQSQNLDFGERMEEHRKRLAGLLQKKGLKWKVERLMAVVKEWERAWGEWREDWDEHLVEILRYVHEKRVAHYVTRFKFPEDVEPNFIYAISPVMKLVAKAEAEGKDVAETPIGDIKLRKGRRREGMGVKEVVDLWNRVAEREELMKKTELTPSLKAHIEEVLSLHPEREWWERLFSLVPPAVKRTRSPSSPRDLGWLFRPAKSGGRIIDWILSLDLGKKENRTRIAVFRKDLVSLCNRTGVEKKELIELMRARGVEIERDKGSGSGEVVFLTGREPLLREFARLLTKEKDYEGVIALLKKSEEVRA